jgi:Oxidoreductase-like protein, N-terminal
MSGCENCVWIQYAQELTEMYKDSGTTAKKIILEKITDPSMQVFLKMELDTIKNKKEISIKDILTKPPKEK